MNDSDDLFGGLPAISNAENAPTTTAPELPTTVDLSAQSISGDAEKIAPSEKRKGGTSLVSSLGSAGTAMVSILQPGGFIWMNIYH